jgi:hypothetical protein
MVRRHRAKIIDGKIILLGACSGILKKISRRLAGGHPLSSKAVPASATGQRALGEANATDDTAVVPPGGTCSVRSVDIARSSRRRQRTESRSDFSHPSANSCATAWRSRGSMVISTMQAWGTLYFPLKQRVVLCKIHLYETHLF